MRRFRFYRLTFGTDQEVGFRQSHWLLEENHQSAGLDTLFHNFPVDDSDAQPLGFGGKIEICRFKGQFLYRFFERHIEMFEPLRPFACTIADGGVDVFAFRHVARHMGENGQRSY